MATIIYVFCSLSVIVLIYQAFRWVVSFRTIVQPGEVHVVHSANKTEVYGDVEKSNHVEHSADKNESSENVEKSGSSSTKTKNCYYAFPNWVPFFGVAVRRLPQANISIEIKNFDIYDIHRLPFRFDVMAFFYIEDYIQAASRIEGNKTLKEHLTKIVESAVRSILGNDTLENILSQRSIFDERFTKEVQIQLKNWGVVPLKAIEMTNLRDRPGEKVIKNIMAREKSCVEKETRITVARNINHARREEIQFAQEVALKVIFVPFWLATNLIATGIKETLGASKSLVRK